MSLFHRIMRRAPAELRERARQVVPQANILATMLNRTVEDEFPAIRRIELAHWNRVLTAAGVAIASATLTKHGFPEYQVIDLVGLLRDVVRTEDPRVYAMWVDCGKAVTYAVRTLRQDARYADEPGEIFALSLGGWIVTRLFERFPQDDWALPLARTLGWAVWEEMGSCWDA